MGTVECLAKSSCETGFIQPVSVPQAGKSVPLFGNMVGSHGIYGYMEGSNCNLIASDYLTNGDYGSCGSPTPYQACCTHGHWLGTAMTIWLDAVVANRFPPNGMHWLTYVDRARSTGVDVGVEFGAYSTPGSFTVTGFDTGYDHPSYYAAWDTHRDCSRTESCPGMTTGR